MSTGGFTVLVVPCYNEATRLDRAAFTAFLQEQPDVRCLFVNDGSTDDTARVLDDLAATSDRMDALHLEHNSGKAEAVRQGMLWAFQTSCQYAGYWDADLSTPLDELPAFCSLLATQSDIDIVTGARIKLIGRQVERNPFRHYSGRAFATTVSVMFGIEMYDTQCGAKLFRVRPEVTDLFAEPFHTRWVFDVELFVRYNRSRDIKQHLVEQPLTRWKDVSGSKMRPFDFLRAPLELLRIHFAYFGSP